MGGCPEKEGGCMASEGRSTRMVDPDSWGEYRENTYLK